MPRVSWSYSMPVAARSAASCARLYKATLSARSMLMRRRLRVQLARKRSSQAASAGSQRRWRSSGASTRPSHFSAFSGVLGVAQGVAWLAEICPPLAKLVSSAGARLAVDDRHGSAAFRKVIGRGDADDAGAHDQRPSCSSAPAERNGGWRGEDRHGTVIGLAGAFRQSGRPISCPTGRPARGYGMFDERSAHRRGDVPGRCRGGGGGRREPVIDGGGRPGDRPRNSPPLAAAADRRAVRPRQQRRRRPRRRPGPLRRRLAGPRRPARRARGAARRRRGQRGALARPCAAARSGDSRTASRWSWTPCSAPAWRARSTAPPQS